MSRSLLCADLLAHGESYRVARRKMYKICMDGDMDIYIYLYIYIRLLHQTRGAAMSMSALLSQLKLGHIRPG